MKLSTHSHTGCTGRSCSQYTFFVTQKFAQAFSSISPGMLVITRRNWKLRLCNFYCGEYPGYQRFFLACDGELRFVGHRPTRVPPKAEDTRGEAFRAGHFLTETGNRAWKASGTQGMWWWGGRQTNVIRDVAMVNWWKLVFEQTRPVCLDVYTNSFIKR